MSYRATTVDGYEHTRQRLETERRRSEMLLGLNRGFAAGLLWEAVRR